ncbi:MAG: hypothetical protein JKY33_04680, partial [Bacteroidia bacterium]|nr:hypothetical protein [Bacteroidia bacterium]
HSRAYYNKGFIYYELDSIEKAAYNFELAIRYDSTYVTAYYNRSLCAEMLGEKEAATFYLDKFKELTWSTN